MIVSTDDRETRYEQQCAVEVYVRANNGPIAPVKTSRFNHAVMVIPMRAGPSNLAMCAEFVISTSDVTGAGKRLQIRAQRRGMCVAVD
jgi:hypothetical protein